MDCFKAKIHAYLNRDYSVILNYHSVINCKLMFDVWTHLSLSVFDEHMALVKKMSNVIPLKEFALSLDGKCLPKNSVAVTFDDGFANNYTHVYPVLKKYGIPATIFLTTGFIGSEKLFWPERLAFQLMKTKTDYVEAMGQRFSLGDSVARRKSYMAIRDRLKKLHPDLIERKLSNIEKDLGVDYDQNDPLFNEWKPLTWGQVKEMEEDDLITFGGHTAHHQILSKISNDESDMQMKTCREDIEKNLKKPVEMFAYPNGMPGDFDEKHSGLTKKYGFNISFSAISEYVSNYERFESIPRWGVGSQCSTRDLFFILSKQPRWGELKNHEKIKLLLHGFCG